MAATLTPVHPGEILYEEFMAPLGLSQNRLAKELGVPVPRIGEIVNRRRAISAGTALRLARYFATSPEFWMNLQTHYDLALARAAQAAPAARRARARRRGAAGAVKGATNFS